MNDDLVKRLREPVDDPFFGKLFEPIKCEAADRIEKLKAALRQIKDLHDQFGPEDEQVIMTRDDMTYFIVCEALDAK